MSSAIDSDASEVLREALALHRAGRLAEAADAYRRIVTADPASLPAVHGLALVAIDLGQAALAIPLLARCAATAPNEPIYACSLGLALLKSGQAEAAAVALLPVANAAPHLLQPRLLLARALGELGRWPEAHGIATVLSETFPDDTDTWAWRGRCEKMLGDIAAAETSVRRALALRPADPELLNNLGVLLRNQGRLEDAVSTYRDVLALVPDHALAHANLGNALGIRGDAQGAEFHLRRAAILAPHDRDNAYNLGVHLVRQDRPAEAVLFLRQALEIVPDREDALTNLGVALVAMGDLAEAETCYRRAIALQPGNAEAHYDLAWLLLLTGRWAEGWEEYEWRWQMPTFTSRRRTFDAPLWDGTPLADGALLVHAEQGLGDAIQYVRYANLAAARCSHLIVECPRPLLSLFQCASAAGLLAGEFIAIGDPQPPYDAQAPFMTLPRLFRTTVASAPAARAYLTAPPPTEALTLSSTGRRRIGLVWAGSPHNRMDSQRSLPADRLRPLFAATDADFVSLQVGPGAEQAAFLPSDRVVFKAQDHVRDFAETAAVIAQLDLVIGVDTAALHLAAALGKPAWLLLAFAPDYRWLQDTIDTPWYPSMRLFRQSERGDWLGVMATVAGALTRW